MAEALRQINCQQLAFDIENSYNTGNHYSGTNCRSPSLNYYCTFIIMTGKLPKSLEEVEPEVETVASPIPEPEEEEMAPPLPPRLAL